jgi:hypothetical protein
MLLYVKAAGWVVAPGNKKAAGPKPAAFRRQQWCPLAYSAVRRRTQVPAREQKSLVAG